MRERAARMAVEARRDPVTRLGALPRTAAQLGGCSGGVANVGQARRDRRRYPARHHDRGHAANR
ncbi:hypothetical protein FGL95_12425 [Nocardiaceae bacterium YC2-7]|uniref:Uncharacterized protein n=1 Tax=Antrihabitans stalactiti TaxID=2584121 RepID=A0A848KC07_9NOCA|nr:hypothetical protein [Antrihabitans stalactiti]